MATQETISINVETRDAINNVAALGAAISAVFTAAAASVMSFADEISDTAQAFGLATGEVLAMSAALDAAGGKGDNAAKMFQAVANSIDDLNNGNLKTLQSFEQLGMSVSELGKMSESEIRNKMIVQLGEMSNKTEAAALAIKVFGKAALGVDFAKLAEEIKNNSAESEKYAGAINDAADAYDNLHHITTQLKLAFAEAFNPVFKMLADIHVTTEGIVDTFKTLATVIIPIVVGITAVKTAIVAVTAATAVWNAVTKLNPWIAGASLIIAGLTAVGMSISGNTDKQEENTKETEKTGEATKVNVVKTQELTNKLKQQRDEIVKIGQEYRNNTNLLSAQYSLNDAITQQSQLQGDIEKAKFEIEKKLQADITAQKEKFNKLDDDAKKRNAQANIDTIYQMTKQADAQKQITAEMMTSAQQTKETQTAQLAMANSLVNMTKDYEKMRIENQGLVLTMKERIGLEGQSKALLDGISATQDFINNSAMLTTNEKQKYLELLSNVTSKEELLSFLKQSQLDKTQALTTAIQNQVSVTGILATSQQKLYENTRTFESGWKQAFNNYADNAGNAAKRAGDIFQSMTSNMNSALDNFVDTGKLSFGDLANSMIKDIIKIELKAAAATFLTASKGMNWGSMLGFADGGTPPVGRASIVGENGPELFVPKSSGTIVPNHQLGGGGGSVVNNYYTVNAVDAKSVATLFAENRKSLYGSVKMAEKETSYRMR